MHRRPARAHVRAHAHGVGGTCACREAAHPRTMAVSMDTSSRSARSCTRLARFVVARIRCASAPRSFCVRQWQRVSGVCGLPQQRRRHTAHRHPRIERRQRAAKATLLEEVTHELRTNPNTLAAHVGLPGFLTPNGSKVRAVAAARKHFPSRVANFANQLLCQRCTPLRLPAGRSPRCRLPEHAASHLIAARLLPDRPDAALKASPCWEWLPALPINF